MISGVEVKTLFCTLPDKPVRICLAVSAAFRASEHVGNAAEFDRKRLLLGARSIEGNRKNQIHNAPSYGVITVSDSVA